LRTLGRGRFDEDGARTRGGEAGGVGGDVIDGVGGNLARVDDDALAY